MDTHLILDLALAWAAAFIGGLLAQRIRQPPILGYVLAGVILGPFTPGPVISARSVEVAAEIGVAFLMFALGVEFSTGELRGIGRVVAIGGPAQILVTMLLGLVLAGPLGLAFPQGLFFGSLLALSSTIVALKILMGRGIVDTRHGKVAIGLLIAQDIAVIPLAVLLPPLTGHGGVNTVELASLAIKAAVVILLVYFVGVRVVPWLLRHTALTRSRELFILGVVALALGTALITERAGLSLAFGAFLAGLVVAESGYRAQVLSEVLPLRDLFTSLFFVSIGLLLDPMVLASKADLIAVVAVVTIAGKLIIVSSIVALLGIPLRVALLTAAPLAQIGEFSFVLGRLGVASGSLSTSNFDLILATSVVTIVVAPALVSLASATASHIPSLGEALQLPAGAGEAGRHKLTGHTIVGGYGRVGREVVATLQDQGIPFIVIEYNAAFVQELRTRGIPVLYGDATSPVVLAQAGVERARLLTLLISDVVGPEYPVRYARTVNPDLDILVRTRDSDMAERIRAAGANAIVQPEFEAGVTAIGHVLRQYGVAGPDLARAILARRASYYGIGNDMK